MITRELQWVIWLGAKGIVRNGLKGGQFRTSAFNLFGVNRRRIWSKDGNRLKWILNVHYNKLWISKLVII